MTDVRAFMDEYDSCLRLQANLPLKALGDYALVSCYKNEADYCVYLVENRAKERCILKVSSGFRQSLLQNEYRMLKQLDAPCFPKALQCVTIEGKTYFLREYVAGQNLAGYAEERRLTDRQVADLALKLCDVVFCLHRNSKPIIHRDIKPQNLILTPDGRLVLIDMDSAQLHDAAKRTDTVILGTEATAAPEQFGARRSDMRADIYGIGMVMLYLLSNDYDLEKLNASPASASLKRIIRRCTKFDPVARYQSVGKLQAALKSHTRRKARGWLLAGTAALLCGLAFLMWRSPPLPEEMGPQPPADVSQPRQTEEPALPATEGLAVFESPVIEAAAAFQLGKQPGMLTYGDLRQLKTLYLCGDIPYRRSYEVEYYSVGEAYLNSVNQPERGSISSLNDLRMMPNLENLTLYQQNISDISLLADLPLKTLALSDNPIEDFSPLAKLTKLQYLDVCSTRFEDASLLEGMRQLRVLRLHDTYVSDIAPLTGLPLEELYLSYSNIVDSLETLEEFVHLKRVRIPEIGAAAVGTLGKLTNLRSLDITRYPHEDLSALSALTNLEYLLIGDSALTTLEGIEAFPYLRRLDLANNNIADLTPLYSLKYLSSLTLNGVPVEDYTQLNQIPSLTEVYVYPDEKVHFPIPEQKFTIFANS